jgi:hypothetical protein
MRRWPLALAALAAGMVAQATDARAQTGSLAGYYQNVALAKARKDGVSGGGLDAQRLRLRLQPSLGAFTLDLAYEQTFDWRSGDSVLAAPGLLSSGGSGGDWLSLGGTIHDGRRTTWRHRFDRLSLAWTHGAFTVTAGRQAIAWATTLFLTPADPFVPLDPSDPFREYRTGVDALRVQWFPGPFSVVDLVVRPADVPGGTSHTALVRAKTTWRGWEVSAWTGALHDQAAGAVGVTRTVLGSAIRAEAEVRRRDEGGTAVRAAVGVDRRVTALGRDLYLVAEYQRDGLGAADPPQLAEVAGSLPAVRRELQVLGRDEAALQGTWQVHPLVGVDLVSLWNLDDGSLLVSPALDASVTSSLTVRLGAFVGTGRGTTVSGLGSEYGSLPLLGYAALSLFF